ncbi:MAG: MmcQ/YjbR family DNA-binding protein [Bacteroidota bacterium]
MVSTATVTQWALSFPETTEEPHFEKTSFRVRKKIFATLDPEKQIACLKFTEVDQGVFITLDPEAIYPVPNKWGKRGWTLIRLEKVQQDLFQEALRTAYCEAAPKKLAGNFYLGPDDKQ